jgi:BirA family biotin operon repressor/biotin-[acetyl-CoA-carboxylase] ligase
MHTPEERHLDTNHLGRRVLVFDRLDSTNAFALTHAEDPGNDGLVILAEEQTAGRGQHGRTWTCPGGAGVLMSALIFPPPELRRPVILTAWAAVSVCELIEKTTGLPATIKWPNDVLVQSRKVCGILIEQARGTVVGIGLNVNQPADHFAGLGLAEAASLAVSTGRTQPTREVALRLIEELDAQYASLCQGELAGLEIAWKRRLGLLGREVLVQTAAGTHRGRLRNVAFAAVETDDGPGARTFQPESVRHLVDLSGMAQADPS